MRRAALALVLLLFALGPAGPAQAQGGGADLAALNRATMQALDAGDTALALDRARAAAEAAQTAGAGQALAVAYALNNLGYALALSQHPEEAAGRLDAAIGFAERNGLAGTDPWYLAMANRASLSVGQGDAAGATALVARVLETGRNTPAHGRAAGIAASTHYAAGEYVQAIAYLEELLAVEPSRLAPYFGAIYTAYAEAQEQMEAAGRTEEAIALIEGRIAILRQFMPGDTAETEQDLLAQKFFQLFEAERWGPAADALRAWAAAAPLAPEERAWVEEMATLTLTATQYSSYTEARDVQLDYAQLALAFARTAGPPDAPRIGLALREVAAAEGNLGRHEQAAQTLRRAARILEATEEGRNSLHLILDDLAANAWQRGDLALSDRFYARSDIAYAAALDTGAAPMTEMDKAIRDTNRARLLSDLGKPDEALALAERAMTHFRADAAKGPQKWNSRAQAARIHAAAAVALADLGRQEEAGRRIDAGLAAAREAMPETHPDLATALGNAADLLFVLGRDDRAMTLLQEAIAIDRTALPEGHPMAVDLEVKLALKYLADGDRVQALPLLRRIAEARKRPAYRARLADASADFEALAWALLAGAGARPEIAVLDEALAALQWTQVTRSAEALAMMEARLASDDPLQAVWLRRRQDLREDHARTTSGVLAAYAGGAEPGTIRALDTRLSGIEAELAKTEAQLSALGLEATGITEVHPLDVADIQARLRPGELLVTFLLPGLRPERIAGLEGSSNLTIAIGPTAVRVAAIPEDSRGALNARIQAFRCEVAVSDPVCTASTAAGLRGAMSLEEEDNGEGFDPAAAHGLYDDLFGGVEELLTRADHLILAPPADLLRLPFQALVTAPDPGPDGPEWLIRRHAVSVLPSVTSLRTLRDRPVPETTAGPARFLGIGDPVIGTGGAIDCATVRVADLRSAAPGLPALMETDADDGRALARPAVLRELPRLADSACELRAIGQVFGPGNSTLLLGEEATETRLKALDASGDLAKADVLVFATHGLTAGEAGARAPGLVLTPPALASAEDDGLLTAAEIATLRLGARLVVLSACNTAAGEAPEAEGLSGLARAFFHAGGTSLLVTHWSVYSSAAVEVSTGFFETLRAEPQLSHAEALRRSLLAIADDPGADPLRRHPAYWAPFAVVGLR